MAKITRIATRRTGMHARRILNPLVFAVLIEIAGCAPLPASGGSPSTAALSTTLAKSASDAVCTEPIAELFERVSPSVVSISAEEDDRFEIEDGIRTAVGSGFIISDDGLVLTNSHVVFDRQTITATLDDGRRVQARLIGAEPIYDLAVLRIAGSLEGLPKAIPGDSDSVRIGEEVLAIGNPLGLEQTLTRG